jgi:diguanylate cyclase (GGDEF)-like protein
MRWPRTASATSPAERKLRGRLLAALWTIGTGLVALALVVRDTSVVEEPRLAALAAVALAFGAALWAGSGRLPRWTFDVALAVGTVLVALLVGATGSATSPFILLFAWQLVFAAYFLPRVRAVAQAAVACIALTVALAAASGDFHVVRWGVALATFVVVTGLVAALRTHVDRLVGALERVARTDPLTGALNRRGFEEALGAERRRAERTGRPLSVVACDIDRFKAINDTHGHPAGDRALVHLVELLRRDARDIDLIGRLGGEEFAILLPETSPAAGFDVAERMRKAVRAAPTPDGIRMTASFGVAACEDGVDPIARADGALYVAKASGRDRTCVASDGGGPGAQAARRDECAESEREQVLDVGELAADGDQHHEHQQAAEGQTH